MDLPAGDCVNDGVGGSFVDDAGALDTGGVLPRDRSWAYGRDFGQYKSIQHILKLPIHKIETSLATRCGPGSSRSTSSLLCTGGFTYFGNRPKAIVTLVDTGWQV